MAVVQLVMHKKKERDKSNKKCERPSTLRIKIQILQIWIYKRRPFQSVIYKRLL